MESVQSVTPTNPSELFQDMNKTGSPETFKKCIYELFHSNGVLNDLRAYLRGHIVNLLKCSRAGEGEPPLCQKRFTQRLEPKFQALNILIAEYLLCMEFSYSFSVFLAEIPLANMVFEFAKTLMNVGPHEDAFGLRFKDRDIWSILNCLGVQCDSEQASNIMEMYKKDNGPSLLFCIMNCVQLCSIELKYPVTEKEVVWQMKQLRNDTFGQTYFGQKAGYLPVYMFENASCAISSGLKHCDCTLHQATLSREESSSSCKTSEVEPQSRSQPTSLRKKCHHSTTCHTCRSQYSRLQEKYGKKKKLFAKNSNLHVDPLVVESLMKKVGFLERKLVDETLEHVSSVYEMQVNMVKTEQEENVKRSLASHAVHFKEKETELEESLKARAAALLGPLDRKKRFLWGLAQALRAQHAHMARAMCAVRAHTARLAQKEQNIKVQLLDAEESLKRRCEEMHRQIAKELSHLEEHIESMKSQRDILNRERSELDNLKSQSENKLECADLRSHYDLLKTELITLKTYFEDTLQKSRCFLERSTITDLNGVNSSITMMNNEVDRTAPKEEARPTQVVNNLKKTKNINFGQPLPKRNLRQQSQSDLASGSRSSSSIQPSLVRLLHENERLRLLAEQQTAQLTELSAHAARLQAALHRRPRPASQRRMSYYSTGASVSSTSNTFGWCKGAGEELSFSPGRPRILVPGDALPFVGVVGERRAANCSRHLMNQIRRSSPRSGKSATKQWPACPVSPKEETEGHVISVSSPQSAHSGADAAAPSRDVRANLTTVTESRKSREKSPNSVLREAKERLKTVARPLAPRQASPSAMLREAKLRLRKLEIEAEAVEQSYMTFRRRRQCRDLEDDEHLSQSDDEIDDDTQEQRAGHSKSVKECNDLLKVNLEKYLTKYQDEYDIGQMHFRNRNTVKNIKKPIPKAFSDRLENAAKPPKRDYLNIPMMDFRNLYCSHSEGEPDKPGAGSEAEGRPEMQSDSEKTKATKINLSKVLKLSYDTELKKIQNTSMIYESRDAPKENHEEAEDENLLRVEVESIERTSETDGPPERSVTLTVESRAEPAAGPDRSSEVAAPTVTILVSPARRERPAMSRDEPAAPDDDDSADVDNYAADDEPHAHTEDEDVSWG